MRIMSYSTGHFCTSIHGAFFLAVFETVSPDRIRVTSPSAYGPDEHKDGRCPLLNAWSAWQSNTLGHLFHFDLSHSPASLHLR